MSKSNIEWTEDTWNPIVGCSLKSPECDIGEDWDADGGSEGRSWPMTPTEMRLLAIAYCIREIDDALLSQHGGEAFGLALDTAHDSGEAG